MYLKADNADNSPNQGSLASLNIKLGKIIVTYNVTVTSATGVVTIKEKKFGISLGGNSVNLFENDYNTGYTTQVTSATNATTGDYRDLNNLPTAVDASSLSGTLAIAKGGLPHKLA